MATTFHLHFMPSRAKNVLQDNRSLRSVKHARKKQNYIHSCINYHWIFLIDDCSKQTNKPNCWKTTKFKTTKFVFSSCMHCFIIVTTSLKPAYTKCGCERRELLINWQGNLRNPHDRSENVGIRHLLNFFAIFWSPRDIVVYCQMKSSIA